LNGFHSHPSKCVANDRFGSIADIGYFFIWEIAKQTMIKRSIAAIAMLFCACGLLHAQEDDYGITPTRSVWSGVYSVAQASRGEHSFFEDECDRCHGGELDGDSGYPALEGTDFMTTWNRQPLLDLVLQMHSAPMGGPDDISMAEATDLTAYFLRENGIPAGSSDLPVDKRALAGIRMDAEPPEAK
jgi:hypothetical protein